MPQKQRRTNKKEKNETREGKERNSLLNTYRIIAIVLGLVIIAETVYIFYPSIIFQKAANVAIPDLTTTGFAKVDKISTSITDTDGELALRAGCYELAAGVEPFQSVSIQSGLDGTVGARPNAHDITKDVFSALKIDVLMVKVTDRRENAYFAKIVLRQGNTILNFDARPSDAIAIAVRMKANVYINETLLKTGGKNVCT